MPGPHALIVEEEYLIAADIEQTLRGAGFEDVTILNQATDALNLAAQGSFDLAVIDAKFGNATAVALSEALRSAGVAVVVTSADLAVQILFTGAIPLAKPFSSATLLAACMSAQRPVSGPLDCLV